MIRTKESTICANLFAGYTDPNRQNFAATEVEATGVPVVGVPQANKYTVI
jgi:hypothetical protein